MFSQNLTAQVLCVMNLQMVVNDKMGIHCWGIKNGNKVFKFLFRRTFYFPGDCISDELHGERKRSERVLREWVMCQLILNFCETVQLNLTIKYLKLYTCTQWCSLHLHYCSSKARVQCTSLENCTKKCFEDCYFTSTNI